MDDALTFRDNDGNLVFHVAAVPQLLDDVRVQAIQVQAWEAGVAAERARIVAWMRTDADEVARYDDGLARDEHDRWMGQLERRLAVIEDRLGVVGAPAAVGRDTTDRVSVHHDTGRHGRLAEDSG